LYKSLRNRIVRDFPKWSKTEMLDDGYHFTVEFDIKHHLIADFAEKELIFKVKRAMDLLPPRQREVLYLRFFVGLQFDHIAQVMDVSKQSIHNLLQKAYKSFRKEWNIAHMITIYL
jgi:RNA polymerase sigma factor (sigma-70 family)